MAPPARRRGGRVRWRCLAAPALAFRAAAGGVPSAAVPMAAAGGAPADEWPGPPGAPARRAWSLFGSSAAPPGETPPPSSAGSTPWRMMLDPSQVEASSSSNTVSWRMRTPPPPSSTSSAPPDNKAPPALPSQPMLASPPSETTAGVKTVAEVTVHEGAVGQVVEQARHNRLGERGSGGAALQGTAAAITTPMPSTGMPSTSSAAQMPVDREMRGLALDVIAADSRNHAATTWMPLTSGTGHPDWDQPDKHEVPSCPEGYYRIWLIVFRCGGGSGRAHFLLPPPQKFVEVQEIPEGVVDFKVMLYSPVHTGIRLLEKEAGTNILQSMEETQGEGSSISGKYRGVHVTCGSSQGREFCQFIGKFPTSISLQVMNFGGMLYGLQDHATATLRFEHRGLSACRVAPLGCDYFSMRDAQSSVANWSRAEQRRYKSAAEAWTAAKRQVSESSDGIPWHKWVVVWRFEPTWESAFRLLDVDGDQLISPSEFVSGFRYAESDKPSVIPTTTHSPHGLHERCPAGYYRSSALLFSCSGGRGTVPFSMPPKKLEQAAIVPEGVRDLHVSLQAAVDVDMYLWDSDAERYVVHWKEGVVNEKQLVANYRGLAVSFSGDDKATPVDEQCNLTGPLPVSMGLQLFNYGEQRTTAILRYSYAGLRSCATAPAGCSVYERLEAEEAAMLWSTDIRRHHPSMLQAWENIHRDTKSPASISWHDWASHWDHLEKWKMVFRFLDVNNDGRISEDEFSRGYRLSESTGRTVTPAPTTLGIDGQLQDTTRTESANTCPDGQYRIATLVLACRGGSGVAHRIVPAKTIVEMQQIPAGLTDLTISLDADGDVDLYFWDQNARKYILHWREGYVNDQTRSSIYNGLSVSFSGDDKKSPTHERYVLSGRFRVPVMLRLQNFGSVKARVTLRYSHGKLDPCPSVPVGCSTFDLAQAVKAIASWSQQLSGKYPTAEQAWAEFLRPVITLVDGDQYHYASMYGLAWHQWEMVAGDQPDWKIAFSYLDTDNDGHVSKEEFTAGYHFAGGTPTPGPVPSSTAASVPALRPDPGMPAPVVQVATEAPAPAVQAAPAPAVVLRAVAPASTTLAASPAPTAPAVTTTPGVSRPVACPSGYYQSSSEVFGCSGGAGYTKFAVAPGEVGEAMKIPQGIRDLSLRLVSDVDFDLYIWDEAAGNYVVNWEEGLVSEIKRASQYKGLWISFGGDDRIPPISENCSLAGTVSSPLTVRLHNHDSATAMATLHHSYAGLSECSTVPEGCRSYDQEVARRTAAICSRQFRRSHSGAEDAWAGLEGVRGGGACILRQNWRIACKHVEMAAIAFRYFDEDNDGCLSKTEFTTGYHMVEDEVEVAPGSTEKLKIEFALPNLNYNKLSEEYGVRGNLREAVRKGIAGACNDLAITSQGISANFERGAPDMTQVKAIIWPPAGRTATSLMKYCCSSTWLNTNIREHVALVARVHKVLSGRITEFDVSCDVEAIEGFRQSPMVPMVEESFGLLDVGIACTLIGTMALFALLFYLVSARSSNIRLHAWSLLRAATLTFAAALVFGELQAFVVVMASPEQLSVQLSVGYCLLFCTFTMMQVAIAAATGGSALDASLDEQVWVVADPARADSGGKIHSQETRTKNLIKSVALIHGHQVLVRKAWYEQDQMIKRIRSNVGFISQVVGFAAVHVGTGLQRYIHRSAAKFQNPAWVAMPVLMNQVLLFTLFRFAQVLLPRVDGSAGILRDPRHDAFVREEVHIAESDTASLACSFLLVQALCCCFTGMVPSFEGMEELPRPLSNKEAAELLVMGLALVFLGTRIFHLTHRSRLATWQQRFGFVWMNTFAMCSAWCSLWVSQSALHALNALPFGAASAELAGQLLFAMVVSFVSFMIIAFFGKVQDRAGPELTAGVVHCGVVALGVLLGMSWRLAFRAALETITEAAPQPLLTRALAAGAVAALVLPASNKLVLHNVLQHRQQQPDFLQGHGHDRSADELDPIGLGGGAREDRLSNVWRFYHQDQEAGLPDGSEAKLTVTIMHASGLRNADWMPLTGKSDPFCTCEIPGKPGSKVSTPVIDDSSNPVWNHTADIMEYAKGDQLLFTVRDSDLVGSDLLGRATLLASQFYPDGFKGDLPLVDSGRDGRATLTVQVKVRSMGTQARSQTQLSLAPVSRAARFVSGWYSNPSGKDLRPLLG